MRLKTWHIILRRCEKASLNYIKTRSCTWLCLTIEVESMDDTLLYRKSLFKALKRQIKSCPREKILFPQTREENQFLIKYTRPRPALGIECSIKVFANVLGSRTTEWKLTLVSAVISAVCADTFWQSRDNSERSWNSSIWSMHSTF